MLRASVHERVRGETEADAFCRLVEPEIDGAYRLAGYLLGNAADAQDAAQDAIAKAWTSFGSLRDRVMFGRWFRRILVNGCRDRLRRRGRVRWVSLDTPDAPEHEAADPFDASLSRDALGRALGVLSPDERSIVVLHYWSDLGTAEIAALLGIPQGTVKFRLHSAYGALRRKLDAASKETGR
jgi:RNA polymerase sigma-70 factor (ECF subfamily)